MVPTPACKVEFGYSKKHNCAKQVLALQRIYTFSALIIEDLAFLEEINLEKRFGTHEINKILSIYHLDYVLYLNIKTDCLPLP